MSWGGDRPICIIWYAPLTIFFYLVIPLLHVTVLHSRPRPSFRRYGHLDASPVFRLERTAFIAAKNRIYHDYTDLNRHTIKDANPYEIVEIIFEYLALSNDRQTIANFASTCKLFSKVVWHRAVAIGGCLTLNFLSQSWQGLLQGLDHGGAQPLAFRRLWSVHLLGKTKRWRELMVSIWGYRRYIGGLPRTSLILVHHIIYPAVGPKYIPLTY